MSRLLIVDDDRHILELTRVFLRNEGFDVCEAADGVEALCLLAAASVRVAPVVI